MEQLKFIALDKDDLDVISTHLQDAVVRVADVHWRPQERRLVMALDRFDWLGAIAGEAAFHRCRTALRFERVNACKCKNVDPVSKDEVLNLLAVEFSEESAPSGCVTLIFSGGAVLRLDVECLEAELVDLGPAWNTVNCPGHVVDATPDPQRAQG
jgi:hypothetical protein